MADQSEGILSRDLVRIRERFSDVLEQAAICAMARGETEVRVIEPMLCPCGAWNCQRVDFGPAGWLCGYCMKPAPAPWERR